jgi:diguanylate cyclase (GGDEF)-like protein
MKPDSDSPSDRPLSARRRLGPVDRRAPHGPVRLGLRTNRPLQRQETVAAPAATPAASAQPAMPDPHAALDLVRGQLSLYASAIEQMAHGLCMFDADDRLLVANQRYREIWGLPQALLQPGTTFAQIMAATHGTEVVTADRPAAADLQRPGRRRREWRMDDDRVIEVEVTRLAGGASVALHADITDKRLAELRIVHMAHHDGLTHLPNRLQLSDMLDQQLAAHPGEPLALLCLDLDQFKAVNDTLGHPAGDALLRQVADRLRAGVRGNDLVARLGGDEFALLQVGAEQPASAVGLAQRLIAALGRPFEIDGQQVHVGASIGIAIGPADGDHRERLLKSADLALYRAKAEGGDQVRRYEPEMDARLRKRRQLAADLRGAIERGEFELAFQAQVALPGLEITGVEALLRWNHPQRGRIPPVDFIALAEETGQIVAIGHWVLRQACEVATTWPDEVVLSVNVSPLQFRSPSLLADVLAAAADAGLPPQRLMLEITEAALLHDTEDTLAVLRALRQRGVRIALDDFGTGYSSLSYLRRFPFDKLKIDRSFVVDAAQGGDALTIIAAVSSLGRGLGMSTTAEGVETTAQLAAVQAAGCTEVQGYLFSRPGTASAIAAAIASGVAHPQPSTTVPGNERRSSTVQPSAQ